MIHSSCVVYYINYSVSDAWIILPIGTEITHDRRSLFPGRLRILRGKGADGSQRDQLLCFPNPPGRLQPRPHLAGWGPLDQTLLGDLAGLGWKRSEVHLTHWQLDPGDRVIGKTYLCINTRNPCCCSWCEEGPMYDCR